MKKITAMFAIAALLSFATPALANGGGHGGNRGGSDTDIKIEVENENTNVTNVVNTTANTGGNSSTGGSARNYVRGGSVDDTTANGGDTGDINTGDAISTTYLDNYVNSSDILVTADCGCRGDLDVDIEVENEDTTLTNRVNTTANTGNNDSTGGNAKNKVTSSSSRGHGHHGSNNSVDDTTANGGDTGRITTGDADAYTKMVNVVNSSVIRVRR